MRLVLLAWTEKELRIPSSVALAPSIVDIKTGAEPPKKAMLNGAEPQMPLEAAIARHGGYGDLMGRPAEELAIWRIGGQASRFQRFRIASQRSSRTRHAVDGHTMNDSSQPTTECLCLTQL